MKLAPYLFWWDWFKKIFWDPFWWVILFVIILWVPFLRVWWWLFLPIMLASQLKILYIWWIGWDFYMGAQQKWVLNEIIPPKDAIMPLKAMEDVMSSIWPLADFANFREIWCEGELSNGPEYCSWEIASIEGRIHFYIRSKQQHESTIKAALYGHYPDIEIQRAEDYVKMVPPTVPNEEWDMYGEDWILGREDAYPIKTYEKFFEPQGERIADEEKRMDPIISLLEAISQIGPGEHYWVQFTTVPVFDVDEPEWRKEAEKIINKIAKRPEKKEYGFFDHLFHTFGELAIGPEKEGESYSWVPLEEDEETGELKVSLTPGEREIITEIENKIKKPAYRTNIRGVYVAKRDAWSPDNKFTRGFMGHFSTANLNYFRFLGDTRPKVHYFLRKRRAFLRARKMFRMSVLRYPPYFPDRHKGCAIISPEELATMFHFPVRISGMVVPTLDKIESKKGGPPPNLPVEDKNVGPRASFPDE